MGVFSQLEQLSDMGKSLNKNVKDLIGDLDPMRNSMDSTNVSLKDVRDSIDSVNKSVVKGRAESSINDFDASVKSLKSSVDILTSTMKNVVKEMRKGSAGSDTDSSGKKKEDRPVVEEPKSAKRETRRSKRRTGSGEGEEIIDVPNTSKDRTKARRKKKGSSGSENPSNSVDRTLIDGEDTGSSDSSGKAKKDNRLIRLQRDMMKFFRSPVRSIKGLQDGISKIFNKMGHGLSSGIDRVKGVVSKIFDFGVEAEGNRKRDRDKDRDREIKSSSKSEDSSFLGDIMSSLAGLTKKGFGIYGATTFLNNIMSKGNDIESKALKESDFYRLELGVDLQKALNIAQNTSREAYEYSNKINKYHVSNADVTQAAMDIVKNVGIRDTGIIEEMSATVAMSKRILTDLDLSSSDFFKSYTKAFKKDKSMADGIIAATSTVKAASQIYGVSETKIAETMERYHKILKMTTKGTQQYHKALAKTTNAFAAMDQAGLDSAALEERMDKWAFGAISDLSAEDFMQMSTMGIDFDSFRKMTQSGDMEGAVRTMLEGMKTQLASVGALNAEGNIDSNGGWDRAAEIFKAMGMSTDELKTLATSGDKLDEALSNIGRELLGLEAGDKEDKFMSAVGDFSSAVAYFDTIANDQVRTESGDMLKNFADLSYHSSDLAKNIAMAAEEFNVGFGKSLSEYFAPVLDGLWEALNPLVDIIREDLIPFLTGDIMPAFAESLAGFTEALKSTIIPSITEAIDWLKESGVGSAIGEGIKTIVGNLDKILAAIIAWKAMGLVGGVVKGVAGLLKGGAGLVKGGIGLVKGVGTVASKAAGGVSTFAKAGGIKGVATATKTAFSGAGGGVSGVLKGAGAASKAMAPLAGAAGLLTMGVDAYKGVKKADEWGTSKISAGIGSALGGASGGIMDKNTSTLDKALGIAGGAAKGAAIGSMIPVVGTAVGAVVGGALAAVGGENIAKAVDAGKNIVAGIGTGIKDFAKDPIGKIADVGKGILGGFKSFFGIKSPSTVMEEQSGYLMQGLSNGMENNKGLLGSAVDGIGGFLKDGFGTALSTVAGIGSNIFSTGSALADNMKNFAGNTWDNIKNTGGAMFDNLKNTASGILDAWKDPDLSLFDKIKETGGSVFSGLAENAKIALGGIKEQLGNVVDFVKGGAGALVDGAKGVGSSVVDGAKNLWSGFTDLLPKFADGGIVRRPTIGLIGEAGPEAIVPLKKSGGSLLGSFGVSGIMNSLGNINDVLGTAADSNKHWRKVLRPFGKKGQTLGKGIDKISKLGGKVSKKIPYLGPILTAVSAGLDIATSDDKVRSIATNIGSILGSMGGGAAGGAALGALGGSLAGPAGAALGSLLGTVAGGIGGAIGGENFTGWMYDKKDKIGSAISGGAKNLGKGFKSRLPKLDTGLENVPYDEMLALLHKGEMVLPKELAETLRNSGALDKSVRISNNDRAVEIFKAAGLGGMFSQLKTPVKAMSDMTQGDLYKFGRGRGDAIGTVNKEFYGEENVKHVDSVEDRFKEFFDYMRKSVDELMNHILKGVSTTGVSYGKKISKWSDFKDLKKKSIKNFDEVGRNVDLTSKNMAKTISTNVNRGLGDSSTMTSTLNKSVNTAVGGVGTEVGGKISNNIAKSIKETKEIETAFSGMINSSMDTVLTKAATYGPTLYNSLRDYSNINYTPAYTGNSNSRASGESNIPYDGYLIKAHAGEMLLPVDLAQQYREEHGLPKAKRTTVVKGVDGPHNRQLRSVRDKIYASAASGLDNIGSKVTHWPVPASDRITSGWGNRTITVNGKKQTDFHNGIDIGAKPPGTFGQDIIAVGDGTVFYAGSASGYGPNTVYIDHGGGLSSEYGHNKAMNVKKGQSVKAGQVIAKVGSEGWSSGPHLHITLRTGSDGKTKASGKAFDPTSYLKGGNVDSFAVDNDLAGSSTGSTKSVSISSIAGEDLQYGFPFFLQADSRWGKVPYAGGTMATSGCGPTSMAMMVTGLAGKKVTPEEVGRFADGKYTSSEGTVWTMFNAFGKNYGISFTQTDGGLGSASVSKAAKAALMDKKPIIMSGNNTEGKIYSSGGHIVVGVALEDGNKMIINNPARNLGSGRFDFDYAMSKTKAVWVPNKAYTGSVDYPDDGSVVGDEGSGISGEPLSDIAGFKTLADIRLLYNKRNYSAAALTTIDKWKNGLMNGLGDYNKTFDDILNSADSVAGASTTSAEKAVEDIVENSGVSDSVIRAGSKALEMLKGIVGTKSISAGVEKHNALFDKYASQYGLDVNLMKAIAMQESGGNDKETGGSSWGLMQINNAHKNGWLKLTGDPATDERLNPELAIKWASEHFAGLLKKYNNDTLKALQSYNFGSVDKLVKAYGDDWIANTDKMAGLLGKSKYGDPNYLKNVLRYYSGSLKAFASGGVIDRPTLAMMGEEAPAYREYVIPTNPSRKGRAEGLLANAMDDILGESFYTSIAYKILDPISSLLNYSEREGNGAVKNIYSDFSRRIEGSDRPISRYESRPYEYSKGSDDDSVVEALYILIDGVKEVADVVKDRSKSDKKGSTRPINYDQNSITSTDVRNYI